MEQSGYTDTEILDSDKVNKQAATGHMEPFWTPGFMHQTNETTYMFIKDPQDMIDPFHSNQNFMTIVLTHTITFIVGVIGNSVVIATWARGGKIRSPTATFLVSLACADLLLLVIFMPLETLEYFVITWDYNGHICKLSSFVELLSGMSSILNLVAVSVERFLVIVYPIHARRWCTVTKSRRSLIFVWLLAVIFAAPPVFNKSTYSMTYYNNETAITAYYCFEKNDNWAIYCSIYELLTLFVIPAFLMIFCYSRVIRELWTSTRVITILTSATNGYAGATSISHPNHLIRTYNKDNHSSLNGNRSYLVRWTTKKMAISVNCEPSNTSTTLSNSSTSSRSRVMKYQDSLKTEPVIVAMSTSNSSIRPHKESSTSKPLTSIASTSQRMAMNSSSNEINLRTSSSSNSVLKTFKFLPNTFRRVWQLPNWLLAKKCHCCARYSQSTNASMEKKSTSSLSNNNHQHHHRCHPMKCNYNHHNWSSHHEQCWKRCHKCLTMNMVFNPESVSDPGPSVAIQLDLVAGKNSSTIWYRKIFNCFFTAKQVDSEVDRSPSAISNRSYFTVQPKEFSATIPPSNSMPVSITQLYKTPTVTDVRNARRQLYCQVIKMLLFIVILFHICWGPRLVFNVIKSTGIGHFDKFAYSARVYFYLLSFIHSALNPFVYGFMSSNFRRMMINSCNHHRHHRKRGNITPVNNSLVEAMATTSYLNMGRGLKTSLSTENVNYNSIQRNSSMSDSYCELVSMTPTASLDQRTKRLSTASTDMVVKKACRHQLDNDAKEEIPYREIEHEINQMVDSIQQRQLHNTNGKTPSLINPSRLKKLFSNENGPSSQIKLNRTSSSVSLKRFKNELNKTVEHKYKRKKSMKGMKKTRDSLHSLTSYSKHYKSNDEHSF